MAPKTSTQRKTTEAAPTPEVKVAVSLTKVQQKKVDGLPTVSARIRYLLAQGLTRSEITKVITNAKGGPLIYQHVRNVEVQAIAKAKAKS